MTKLLFTPSAWEEYVEWQGQDKKTLRRINLLIQSIMRTPFEGVSPAPCRWWSRFYAYY